MSTTAAQPQVQAHNNRGETQDKNEQAGNIRQTNIAAAKGIRFVLRPRIGGSLENIFRTKRYG